ncbi:MAG: hypothetical protein RLZZ488_820 [Pseudomonadota bacterium]|jgi:S-adenosylmethionine-diacylglycerol 3-amino-3-carboxypropyl transferase
MSKEYFNTLNYTLANEDTSLEMNVLPEGVGHVVAVAGSGARVLPLFAKSPALVTCVDLSREQLWLAELRFATARVLSHTDFLKFWGYPPEDTPEGFRLKVIEELDLDRDCREFFRGIFQESPELPLLYSGKWERTFEKISTLCRSLLGAKCDEIFKSESMSEHLQYMRRSFPYLRWNLLIFMIGNSTFFNTLLYKGHFPKKNISETHWQHYQNAYNRLFSSGLPRENYFLQLTLLGRIVHAEGNPIECNREVYSHIQAGLRKAKVQFVLNNVVDCVSSFSAEPADFVSLSDVPSYFDDQTSREFLIRMGAGLNSQALVVARYYLRVIDWMSREGFAEVTENYRQFIDAEKTQMYHVDVFKKI